MKETLGGYKVLIGCVFALGLVGFAEGQQYAPISTRDARPFNLPFFRFPFSGPLLKSGQSQAEFDFEAANSMTILPDSANPVFQEDIEADILECRYQKMMPSGWQWGVDVPFVDMGPGFMDPMITWYHRAFLSLLNDRNTFRFGRHIVQSPNEPTSNGGLGVGDVSATLAHWLGSRTFASVGVKLPTGNPNGLLGSGNFDLGLQLEQFEPLGKNWGLSLQAAGIYQGASTFLRHSLVWGYQLSAALTLRQNSRDCWTVQLQRESSALKTGIPVSDQIQAITSVGYRRKINPRDFLTFYFSEDLDLLNPNLPNGVGIGPDFTIGVNLTTML